MENYGPSADSLRMLIAMIAKDIGIKLETDNPITITREIRRWVAEQKGLLTGKHASRCRVCDWPLANSIQDGCVEGNCSYRPRIGSDEYLRIAARREQLHREDQGD
jgi:hypothetical protein